jgi:hypothetical protein
VSTTLRIVKRRRGWNRKVPRPAPEVGTHEIVYEVAPASGSDPHDPNVGLERVRVRLSREGIGVGLGVGYVAWYGAGFVAWGDLEEYARLRLRDETERLRERYYANRLGACRAAARGLRLADLPDLDTETAEQMARWFYESQAVDALWSKAPAHERADLVRRMRELLDAGIVAPLVAADDEEDVP